MQLDPFLRNLNPFLAFLGLYKRELAAMFANDTATLQATDQIGQDRVHYLRLTSPVNPEALAVYPQRQGWHRGNPYYREGAYDQIKGGLPVFNPSLCFTDGFPTLGPPTAYLSGGAAQPHHPVRAEQREHDRSAVPQAGNSRGRRRVTSEYPHVREDPKPSPVELARR